MAVVKQAGPCMVRGCTGRTQADHEVCFRCRVMLQSGKTVPSTAWFATELEFLTRQNEEATAKVMWLNKQTGEGRR